MADAFLDGWLARIGYGGPTPPTVDTLHALAGHHVRAVPFENLDPWLGRAGGDLAPEALHEKVVGRRRGGYCFELNGLMLAGLERLGFSATALAARVYAGRPRDAGPPRTHAMVRVDLGGAPWIVDVGVGAQSATAALRWEEGVESPTPDDVRRFVRDGSQTFHQVRQGDAWIDVCAFGGEEMPLVDREVAHWYTSAHPRSHFRSRLVVARATDAGRVHLLNRRLRERDRAGALLREVVLDDEEALRAALAAEFGLAIDGPIPLPPAD